MVQQLVRILGRVLGPWAWWNVAAWAVGLAAVVGYALGRVPFLPAMAMSIAAGAARKWRLRHHAPHPQGDRR
ncbi:hypothetical protein [Oryzihumus sp.]|uniref:hypothetical protein n=1 Tax=Oryzihumus sp. TaxID=1968903 RepID=UPI002EDA58C1